MIYGIPYQGSKTKIANEIITALPAGNRFVDLFGGGFAVSQCALLSGKYDTVLYNDISPILIPLIQDAINGKYDYDTFKPEFITRDKFFQLKEKDAYIKYIWSFANNGNDYLYDVSKEQIKHKIHDYVVFDIWDPQLDQYKDCDIFPLVGNTIHERRLYWQTNIDRHRGRNDFVRLQQLERIERLQKLNKINHLKENIEWSCCSYTQYKFQYGDVVYCDIPYPNSFDRKGTSIYDGKFDFTDFIWWASNQYYPIYFSSYRLGAEVWHKRKNTQIGTHNKCSRVEVLYKVTNRGTLCDI